MTSAARRSRLRRGLWVAGATYIAVYALIVLTRLLPSWVPVPHLLEYLSYDVRAGLVPPKAPLARVVVLSKADENDAAMPMRDMLAQALPAVRAAGARSMELDVLLFEPSASEAQDAALAQALSGEDTLLAWELRTGASSGARSVVEQTGRSIPASAHVAARGARPALRDAVPFEGLINFQVDGEMGRTLRHVEMWLPDPRAEGGTLAARASFGFQIYLMELARDAADRAAIARGDPRLAELAAARDAGAVRAAAVRAAAALRGARAAAFAEKTAEMLLARVEYRVLMARAGVPGALARAAVEALRREELEGFLPVPAQAPRLEWSPVTGEHSRLIVDFHGRRRGEVSPFRVLELADAARPGGLAERALDDSTESNEPDAVVGLVAAGSCAVAGRVAHADGSAAGGVRVIVECASGRFGEAVSGADGAFRVEGLTPGLTRYRAFETRGGVSVMSSGAGPTLAGAEARLEVGWPQGDGDVTLALAEAAPAGAEVVLVGRVPVAAGDARSVMVHARGAVSGKEARIGGMPAGSYSATMYAPGGAAGKAKLVRVQVARGVNARAVALVARGKGPAGVALAGRVVEAGAGAEVELIDLRSGERHAAACGADGAFRVAGLSEGAYLVLGRKGALNGVRFSGRGRLDGAIVLVGSRLLDDHDYFYPPVDLSRSGLLFGVEVHGYVVDNLLTGSGIRDAAITTPAGLVSWLGVVSTFGVCLVGSLVLSCFALVPGIVAWGLVLVGWCGITWFALAYQGVWLDVSLPAGALVGVLLIHMYEHYRNERVKAERRKQIFGRFVNPEMVNRILELDEVVLEGHKSQITVLFSDIRGFTTISEGMDPKALLELLNEYFSLMNPILLKNNGTHDKYIGDAIMGFFGAPLACKDHALQAVATAVEMLEVNDRMRRERPGWFDIGFGINTGEAVTGFVGAQDGAVSYSAIGDTVNLASRLEGLNKEYGTHILISESTYLKVRDAFECVEIAGGVKVKGKKEAVKIFEVKGRRGILGGS